MRKIYKFLAMAGLLISSTLSNAQALNDPAGWPNASWTLSGTYDVGSLLSDPTISSNFSYDDDAAGGGSTDVLNAESPVIDLTPASLAGETWVTVEYDYDYNLGDVFNLEYFDADLSTWVVWESIAENSFAESDWCTQISAPSVTSSVLDISTMTSTQLSGFQYRFAYDASAVWGWGFCVSSPTISSQMPPSCLDPTALQASNVSSSSLDVTWTENGTATVWNIEYGTPGFIPGTGNELGGLTGTSSNPASITGLSPNTTYDIYVQADCGINGSSDWSAVETVSTYGDCFSSGSFSYVSNSNLANSLNGFIANTPGDYITLTFTGGTTETCCDDWFITDAANGTGNIIATGVGSIVGSYESTTGEISFYVVSDGSVTGQPFVYSLSCAPPPSCLSVTDLTIDNLTTTDVTLSWTSQGVETSWNIEYGAPGFTPGTDTEIGAITGTANNPETISGLTPNTSYDIYVQADCGGGDTSPWELVNIFTGYCTPVYTFTSDYLSKFETVGAVQNVLYSANTQPAGGYEDLTSTLVIQQFTNDQFDFETNFEGGANTIRIWVDWNNDLTFDASEEVYNLYQTGNPNNAHFGSIAIPTVAPGEYRMRVRSRWNTTVPGPCDTQSFGSAIDVTLEVLPAPTCPRPIDLLVTSLTPNSAEISWTAGGLETEWIIEYGEAGFVLGTGTSVITSTIPEQLTGLFDNTSYDVYVRAVCAPGDSSAWSTPSTFNTPCFAFEAIDFCESFDSDSETQACWTVLNENGDADTWDLNYSFNTNSGDQVAALDTDFNGGNNDDWLITPQITLTGNEIMNFFYRVESSFEPNDFQVLLSTTGNDPLDFEDTLMFLASYSNTTYQDSTIDLSAFTGDVYIAFHVPAGGSDGWILYIDDVCFDVCIPAAGQDGENDVCRADGLFDLNPSIVKGQENGAWVFPTNQQLVVDDTLFNVTTLPAGSYEVLWIVEGGCTSDTTVSVVNVFPPSSAGVDGSIIACRNEPINLFDGLSGNLDLGGVWYNPSNTPLTGAITTTSNIPGSFNFLYITSNGVCAADTSLVEVIVGTCDFLSLGEEQFAELSVYPNPASEVLNIEASSNAGAMNIEILDINGRIVVADATALANSTSATLSIAHLEKGVYTLRIFSNEGQRTFKIVKQ
jgi:hypothetical protein